MGKKSKIYKCGLPRTLIKKSQNNQVPKIQINPQPQQQQSNQQTSQKQATQESNTRDDIE